jgi:hypothetical protein
VWWGNVSNTDKQSRSRLLLLFSYVTTHEVVAPHMRSTFLVI